MGVAVAFEDYVLYAHDTFEPEMRVAVHGAG
jgi:hypothetical protein